MSSATPFRRVVRSRGVSTKRRWFFVVACYTDGTLVSVEEAASPRVVGATYYAGAVTVTWGLVSD
jgi:hypothetical protein